MKLINFLSIIFALAVIPKAWANAAQSLPSAKLSVSTSADRFTRAGIVSAELLNPDSPSCPMVLARGRYLEKQIAEVNSTANRHQIAETLELRKRFLQLHEMLSGPWAAMQARFVINPEWAGPIQSHSYAVAVDIAGRQWTSSQGFLPDGEGINLAGNDLSLKWTWNAYEFCLWNGSVQLELTLLPH